MDASASLSLYVAAARPLRPAITSVQIIALAYAAWLVALTVVSNRPESSLMTIELVLLAGAVPAVLQGMLLPADTRGNAPGMWFMWAFVTLFLASYLANAYTWQAWPTSSPSPSSF